MCCETWLDSCGRYVHFTSSHKTQTVVIGVLEYIHGHVCAVKHGRTTENRGWGTGPNGRGLVSPEWEHLMFVWGQEGQLRPEVGVLDLMAEVWSLLSGNTQWLCGDRKDN
ncbi:hypothetical protein RRG08_031483 [Elysia crispata]|uniref:Uncharacterized protein n=1 Tax=Elysia crispata TaxID=231223 RepID=A0AAE0ZP87_9GAST|nr:hypothetical protein RRG08_031483 [Elysia crispata]